MQANATPIEGASPPLPEPGASDTAIVIVTFNQSHFLEDAIASALAQTQPASEVIVVDDESTDDPGAVVTRFAGVRLIRQENQGLPAARNAGLHAARAAMIIFLDADDRLMPIAVEAGLACHARSQDCAFVYGAHRHISGAGVPTSEAKYNKIGEEAFSAFLRGNLIGMHATVMYRRDVLTDSGGFDVALRRCEDYAVYLRIAQHFRIASHPAVVAEYRKHGDNMSSDHLEMLRWALKVQYDAVRPYHTPKTQRAWRAGRLEWKAFYAEQIILEGPSSGGTHQPGRRLRKLSRALRASPWYVMKYTFQTFNTRIKGVFLPPIMAGLRAIHVGVPPPGRVRLGDLAQTSPIDGDFGYGRGNPIDRFYIESFLDKHKSDIAGRVLEVGDDSYSRRFGSGRVQRQDVLHVHSGNPGATIIGDLSMPNVLPRESFDCIVLTQTLHLIYDMRAALKQLHAALRPGGVLLLTVPGISQIDRGEWQKSWYWSLTPQSLTRLLSEVFDTTAVVVESNGNVFAAVAFLHGLAQEEVPRAKLLVKDAAYPVIVAARARKMMRGTQGP